MRLIITDSKNKERTFQTIGKLVKSGKRNLVVLYDAKTDLNQIESQMLADFGESILESGLITFEKRTDYKPEKDDQKISSVGLGKITTKLRSSRASKKPSKKR